MDKALENAIKEAAENVPKVYESGYKKGLSEGGGCASEEDLQAKYEEGYSEGLTEAIATQEEFLSDKPTTYYDKFWKSYLGAMEWNHLFSGRGWNDDNFYPTENMQPRHAYMMFRDTGITDIWGRLEELGLTLNFSNCTNFYNTFYGYIGTWHGIIDMSGASTSTGSFSNNSNLVEIKKLIVSENTVFNTNFTGCTALETMPVEGTIGKNGFNVSPCTKLTKASIESIINALSEETTGLTVTLSQAAVNNAFTADEWSALEGTKSNWTISLV